MEIKQLQSEFTGIGEMRGYTFKLLKSTDSGYLYELTHASGKVHYEVFEKKINNYFGCVSYPTSKAFGIWAWCISNLEQSLKKLDFIEQKTALLDA